MAGFCFGMMVVTQSKPYQIYVSRSPCESIHGDAVLKDSLNV
jgi:hypothetical protein